MTLDIALNEFVKTRQTLKLAISDDVTGYLEADSAYRAARLAHERACDHLLAACVSPSMRSRKKRA